MLLLTCVAISFFVTLIYNVRIFGQGIANLLLHWLAAGWWENFTVAFFKQIYLKMLKMKLEIQSRLNSDAESSSSHLVSLSYTRLTHPLNKHHDQSLYKPEYSCSQKHLESVSYLSFFIRSNPLPKDVLSCFRGGQTKDIDY